MMTRNYGWRPDLPDHRDYRFKHAEAPIVAPPKVDLRPLMPAIYNQLDLGSCTANAGGAAFQFDQIKQGQPNWVPSRLALYYGERAMEGTIKEDAGAQIRDCVKVLAKTGVAPETLWPYDVAKFAKKPPVKYYKVATQNQALRYERVDQTPEAMEQVLAKGYPIIMGFAVYQSFESPQVAKTGMVPLPQKDEKDLGGHAVLCLSGDTKVPLLDGTSPSLRELAETKGQASFWVYSCTPEGRVVPGKAYAPRKTGTKEVVLVTLDNGEKIRCTPNHPFLCRNGVYKAAGELIAGDSLMPLYRKLGAEAGMKVVSVDPAGVEDVYDLTVETHHNFAVEQGVFVHNCVGYDRAKRLFIVRNSWGAGWGECFAGSTRVSLLDGTNPTLKELVSRGEPVWVYSFDLKNNKIVPALAYPKSSGIRDDLVEVTLDNGEKITCTKEHRWMLKNGEYKEAYKLQEGESLKPLYKKDDKGYERILSPSYKWVTTHWLVVKKLNYRAASKEHILEYCKGENACELVVHHKDFNGHNNSPDNLEVLFQCQHNNLHYKISDESKDKRRLALENRWRENHEKWSEISRKNIKIYNDKVATGEIELTEKQIEARRKNGALVGKLEKKSDTPLQTEAKKRNAGILGKKPKTEKQKESARTLMKTLAHIRWRHEQEYSKCDRCHRSNHKVVKIKFLNTSEEVFDLQVPNYHNFALSSGVFVHNSGYFYVSYDYFCNPSLADDVWVIYTVEDGDSEDGE